MPSPTLHLGASSALEAGGPLSSFLLPAHQLVTHGVGVGMTGSGKTGALTVLCEEALRSGQDASLPGLLDDLAEPPIESVGALSVDAFLPKAERQKLASARDNLLASPTFAAWRTGQTLDVGAWLTPSNDGLGNARKPAVIVSVAHLDDAERNLVLGVVLEAKSATHPDSVLQKLPPRWFLVKNVHEKGNGVSLLHPRWATSFLRGPMTRGELQRALRDRRGSRSTATATATATATTTTATTTTGSAP